MTENQIKYLKVLNNQVNNKKITKKEYKKELNFFKKNILKR
jgi:hypothetical protein